MEIQPDDITYIRTIYSSKNNRITVKTASIKHSTKEYAVKITSYNHSNAEKIEAEAKCQMALKHQNIMKLITYFKKEDPPELHMVMKFYPRKDLKEKIRSRMPSNYWPEDELLSLFRGLVDAFVYMQKNSYSHRDIKPANIFTTKNGKLKVGDFGAVKDFNDKLRSDTAMMTIQGTPFYLSPKVRQAYMLFQTDSDKKYVSHNPFKSDVYSLGITFLTMCVLSEPNDLPNNTNLKSTIERYISQIRYSPRVKLLLHDMLEVNEDLRCDFINLYANHFLKLGEAVRNQDIFGAKLALEKLVNRNQSVNILVKMNQYQTERLLNTLLTLDGNSRNKLELAILLAKNGRLIYVIAGKCEKCKKGCVDPVFSCCGVSYHSECLKQLAPQIADSLSCLTCKVEYSACTLCKKFIKTDSLNLQCGHTQCNKCTDSLIKKTCQICQPNDSIKM